MSVGVSHTYGGTVVVVDLADGRRWDLTPDMAEAGAAQCEGLRQKQAEGTFVYGMAIIQALDERQFRFAGHPNDLETFARDLRAHAASARAMLGTLKAGQP